MSAQILLNTTERFANGLSDAKVPEFTTLKLINDIRPESGELFKTKEKYFKEDVSVTLSAISSSGTKLLFPIPKGDAFIGEMFLDVVYTNSTSDVCALWGYNMIQNIYLQAGGGKLMEMSGEAMAYLQLLQHTAVEDRIKLVELCGGVGGVVSSGSICFPIIAPGSKGLIKNITDNQSNPCFPIGLMNTDTSNLYITIRPFSEFVVTGSGLAITSITLRYKRYAISNDLGIPSTKTGKAIIYKICCPYVYETEIQTANVSGTIKESVKGAIVPGELQTLIVAKSSVNAFVTNKEFMAGMALPYMQLKVGGQTVYEHNSLKEAELKSYMNYKNTTKIEFQPQINGSSTTLITYTGSKTNTDPILASDLANLYQKNHNAIFGYYYCVPFSPNYGYDLWNYGSHGVCVNSEQNIDLTTTISGAETPRVKVIAIYKSMLIVRSDNTCEHKVDYSTL